MFRVTYCLLCLLSPYPYKRFHDVLFLVCPGYLLFHIHDDLCLVCPLFMLVGGGILKLLWSPEIDSKESIPTWFLAPIDCSKIPARENKWRGLHKIWLYKNGRLYEVWFNKCGGILYINSGLIISVDYMRSREYWRMIKEDQDSHCRIIWHLSHPPSPLLSASCLSFSHCKKRENRSTFFTVHASCLSQFELTGPQTIIQYSQKRKGAEV
jgi:hypothetical protein